MLHRLGVVALVLLMPASGWAEVPLPKEATPEQLLPAGTQIYWQWDGLDAHRPVFVKTALGKIMQGDMGVFVDGILAQLHTTITELLLTDQQRSGVAPDKLKELKMDAAEAPRLLEKIFKQGFTLAVEVRSVKPLSAQATLFFPQSPNKPCPLASVLRLATSLGKIPVQTKKVSGRTIHSIVGYPVQASWWTEGKYLVLSAGTDAAEAAIQRMHDKSLKRLTENPLFKKLQTFRQFETANRAYIDTSSLIEVARGYSDDVAGIITDLGFDQLRSLTFCSGFDGIAERSVIEMDMPGPRKGFLRLAGSKPFTLADVPPLPADCTYWSMSQFDLAQLYDVLLDAAQRIAPKISPQADMFIQGCLQQINDAVGIDIRKDLLGSLGDRMVIYNSPSEGPLGLGAAVLIKVKNAKKLQVSLETMVKNIARMGLDIKMHKKNYHGADLREIHVQQPGMIFLPTYTFHNDWLVLGYYPQTVQGYLLRVKGELPVWKPDDHVQQALKQLPKQFVSVSVRDPRPTVQFVLSLMPLAATTIKNLIKDSKHIDVSSIPNANVATRHLFPNVSVTTDDGKVRRMETLSSLSLPF